jgi:hypothetical protein
MLLPRWLSSADCRRYLYGGHVRLTGSGPQRFEAQHRKLNAKWRTGCAIA